MAYDKNFPADDSYLAEYPAGAREQSRAIKEDQIVDAGRVIGLEVGNKNGNIPINNGTENANLNAALLNGKDSGAFAPKVHSHDAVTQNTNGFMINSDKKKLDGIASGAEVNQNAIANIKVGGNVIQADNKQDTVEITGGTNISVVGDPNNDRVTIGLTGKVASAVTADKVQYNSPSGTEYAILNATVGENDYAHIKVGSTATNAGYMILATGDDKSEPIMVRQYGASGYRQANLLDGNGNTAFPGTVSAPTFSGSLNGNASSASGASQLNQRGNLAPASGAVGSGMK